MRKDLIDGRISWKVVLAFIPVAFLTYFIHESGHWLVGELLGNDMTLGLNNASPRSGFFIDETHALWSAVGGPAFSILQALVFLVVVLWTRSVYAYSFLFFAAFSRFFSIVFGGLSLQDEGRIATMTGTSGYLVAGIVLLPLIVIVWKGSRAMGMSAKSVGQFVVLGTLAMLMVIGVDHLLS